MLFLQRVIGNRNVERALIARQQSAPTLAPPPALTSAGPLSPAQIQSAIIWYRVQPTRYTREIIMEIQFEVGTTPTGRMGAVDVQAVAKRQESLNVPDEPKLKIDGKAGPRTLPSVFKFGLSKEESVSEYTKKARELWDNKGSKSEEEVAKTIVNDVINTRLATLKIPPIKVSIVTLKTRGAFSSGEWELKLDPLQFQPGKFHDLRDTTATIYHETRHAEQDFRMGQLLARQGKNADQINDTIGLNPDVAKAAIAEKDAMTPMQALIAQGWFDAEFSVAGLEHRRRNSAELKASFDAREAACDAFKTKPTTENRQKLKRAKARFDKAVDEHDDMPHEFDAERLEAKVRNQFGKAEDHDDPCSSV